MIDKSMIETLTRIYIYSYGIAMQEVKNPSFAVEIAMSVTMLFKATETQKKPEQLKINPMEYLLASIMQGAQQEDDAEPGDGPEMKEMEGEKL